MRYFIKLAYNGSRFEGWQRQPRQPAPPTVQASLEDAISTIIRQPVELVGCGRTDTGVHAKDYYAHFDSPQPLPNGFLAKINGLIGKDIAVFSAKEVSEEAHARFDAVSRSYEYFIHTQKDPFRLETSLFLPKPESYDLQKMQQAAGLLLEFEEFAPFCLANTDSKTRICHLSESRWEFDGQRWCYRISSNRFLRGMIRLVVGMCLNVGAGRLSLDSVRQALEKQILLDKPWSVAPQGLFLTDIRYPYSVD